MHYVTAKGRDRVIITIFVMKAKTLNDVIEFSKMRSQLDEMVRIRLADADENQQSNDKKNEAANSADTTAVDTTTATSNATPNSTFDIPPKNCTDSLCSINGRAATATIQNGIVFLDNLVR